MVVGGQDGWPRAFEAQAVPAGDLGAAELGCRNGRTPRRRAEDGPRQARGHGRAIPAGECRQSARRKRSCGVRTAVRTTLVPTASNLLANRAPSLASRSTTSTRGWMSNVVFRAWCAHRRRPLSRRMTDMEAGAPRHGGGHNLHLLRISGPAVGLGGSFRLTRVPTDRRGAFGHDDLT